MNTTSWHKQQQQNYHDIKQNTQDLIKLCGKNCSDLKITFTYVAIADSKDITKTHHYFIFVPFITNLEKHWHEDKIKPPNHTYTLGQYSCNIPYFYIKDDTMNIPEEFYRVIHKTGRDVYVIKYENHLLAHPEYVYIGPQPTLYEIDFDVNTLHNEYEEWYRDKFLTTKKAKFTFVCPLKKRLPFPTCDIQLSLSGRHTFFEVSRLCMQ